MLNKICLRCGSPLQFSGLGMWICPNAANHGLSKLQGGRALKPIVDKKYVAHQLSELIEEYIEQLPMTCPIGIRAVKSRPSMEGFVKWLKEYK